MKKILIRTSLVLLLIAGMASNAAALQLIQGGLSFGGGYSLPTAKTLGNTTSFDSFINPKVVGGGSFDFSALTDGMAISMSGFGWSPFINNTTLWSKTIGTTVYSFNMTSLVIDTQSDDNLTIEGTGIAKITGFTDTAGTWVLTANTKNQTFSFSGSSGVNVPEPLTLILFGTGLLGLAGLRRKLS
jgi:hypothetical protein